MNVDFLGLLELLKGGKLAFSGGTRPRNATGQRDRAPVRGTARLICQHRCRATTNAVAMERAARVRAAIGEQAA